MAVEKTIDEVIQKTPGQKMMHMRDELVSWLAGCRARLRRLGLAGLGIMEGKGGLCGGGRRDGRREGRRGKETQATRQAGAVSCTQPQRMERRARGQRRGFPVRGTAGNRRVRCPV